MCTRFSLIFLFLVLFSYHQVSTRGGRGGGSRGGGSRSGGSRSGSSRSGGSRSSSGRIGVSSRYSTWSNRHGFTSTFRYKTTSYSNIRSGISSGYILMSSRYRKIYVDNDISICYNESPLYERNISVSPWFVCPWDDSRSTYCCGDELEERCCTFFERPGVYIVLTLVCFCLPLIFVFYYFYTRPKKKSSLTSVDIDKAYNENPNLVQLPPVITPNLENIQFVPTTNSDEQCPLYPVQNYTDPTTPYPIETLPVKKFPTTSYNTNDTSSLPYPTDLTMPKSQSQGSQFNSLSYDDSGLQYSLIPPEHPPPSYSDVIKDNKFDLIIK